MSKEYTLPTETHDDDPYHSHSDQSSPKIKNINGHKRYKRSFTNLELTPEVEKDLSQGVKMQFQDLQASNGGVFVIGNESRNQGITYTDQILKAVSGQKIQSDTEDKLVIHFDGQEAVKHKNGGIKGAINDVLTGLKA